MTELRTVEQKPRQISPGRPAPSLAWTLDPTTGKPMARWTIGRPEMIERLMLPRAA
jgi:hypothetical protein